MTRKHFELAVGDVLTTVEQLDACPVGTVLHASNAGTAVLRVDSDRKSWRITGSDHWYYPEQLLEMYVAGLRVVWLPPPPPITEVTWETVVGVWSHGDGAFLVDEVKSHPLLEPLAGKAVVVTVRVKEADDAKGQHEF